MVDHNQIFHENMGRPPGEGAKFDANKPRFDLIDPEFELTMAIILTQGAKTHGEYSWQTLARAEARYTAALKRHVNAMHRGEFLDPDSGQSHAGHIAVNAMFLDWFQRMRQQRIELEAAIAAVRWPGHGEVPEPG